MIVEKTPITEQYFSAVQKLVVLQLGMVLLPVANQGEASQLITQLVSSYVSGETLNYGKRITCFPLSHHLFLEKIHVVLKEYNIWVECKENKS